ncbi:MAG: 23S rRNA (adenine(2030)-N(6))-methyltransferase RlmJ [Zetaproteobacteria bacterium CG1_02_55_237]|nr:MAG: 23S rRNA (adenine(2030)-N(6))-methyltransferase RlmJ [Zetaproteobacteria bacterium CG1_02_55_237]
MLSYQHSYHAGNHADVLKHIVLGEVLAAMQQKDAPMFALDAFASRGNCDLDSAEALKNREFDSGIGRIWPHRHEPMPEGVARWLLAVRSMNNDDRCTTYPGSTALLHHWQRDQDRLAACEMHPQEFDALRSSFRSSRSLALHKRDAYEALRALLPPKEKRGLVFIDPSYEEKDEYRRIAQAVTDAYPHFRAGVYLIWYPLLPAGRQRELFRALQKSGIRKILRVELEGNGAFGDTDRPMQMQGSGMLIVNPPWHAAQSIRISLNWLKQVLCPTAGTARSDWLVPE